MQNVLNSDDHVHICKQIDVLAGKNTLRVQIEGAKNLFLIL